MKKRNLLAVAVLATTLFVSYDIQAQTANTSAALDITLQCAGGTGNRTGIAYNPNQNLYYSVNAGAGSYPIETFTSAGVQVATVSQGFDYRGAWWNPNTNVLEGNGYASTGITVQNLDANFYALGSGTNVIPNVAGPDAQSSGNYDWNSNQIIHYLGGNIYKYGRAAHNLVSTLAITGLPVPFSNINSNSIAYTGVPGMEIGIYDHVNKAFYFINKTSGEYIMTCQLPLTAPAANIFKMGYANGRLWLYNATTSQWQGYITVNPCNPTVSTISVSACNSYVVPSTNASYTTSGIYLDTIQNSAGCDSLITINLTILNSANGVDTKAACNYYTWIDGNSYTANNNTATFTIVGGAANGCDSLVTLNLTINTVSDITTTTAGITISANNSGASYQWLDCNENYAPISGATMQSFTPTSNGSYAVQITQDGCIDTSACVVVTTVGVLENNFGSSFNVYPNPTNGNFTIDLGDNYNSFTVKMTDLNGRIIQSKEYHNTNLLNLKIDQSAGVYLLIIESAENKAIVRLIKE
jgi:hypothetical protein